VRHRVVRTALVALVALVAVVPAGCGIPDRSAVFTRGAGPSPGTVPGVDTAPTRSNRTDTTDPAQFVDNLLDAAAGELDGAVGRVRAFMVPAAGAAFNPDKDKVAVVRLTEPPLINPGSTEVLLRVQQVGVLGRWGILSPPESTVGEYTLDVGTVPGGSGLYLTGGMPGLMISTEALDRFYQRRSLYFWNAERTRLVPDLRYLPREVPAERQPTDIIDWLTAGPSEWLGEAVQPLPAGIKRAGTVPAVDGKLKINITGVEESAGDAEAMQRLAEQIMWSLRPTSATALDISVDNQIRATLQGGAYLTANPAWRPDDTPERFCVLQGQVRRLKVSAQPGTPVPTLDETSNRDVVYASLARAGTTGYAALVVAEKGKHVLRVGRAEGGRPANLSRSPLPDPVGRPIWAGTPAGSAAPGVGLVVAGGKLYSFTSDGAAPRPVDWPGAPGPISAVAVAPDGQRLAVLAAGRLHLTAVWPVGPGLRAGFGRPVATIMKDLSAVDWSSELSLLVAGVRPDTGRVALGDVPIDGAVQQQTYRLPDLGLSRVGYLVAFPANPASSTGGADAVAYTATDVSWDAQTSPQPIDADDVAGPAVPQGTAPSAPFFLE
jgi:hypothetical protein